MEFNFEDVDATYSSTINGAVLATLKGETEARISADSFFHAKAAVQDRLQREQAAKVAIRQAQIDAAWASRRAS